MAKPFNSTVGVMLPAKRKKMDQETPCLIMYKKDKYNNYN